MDIISHIMSKLCTRTFFFSEKKTLDVINCCIFTQKGISIFNGSLYQELKFDIDTDGYSSVQTQNIFLMKEMLF